MKKKSDLLIFFLVVEHLASRQQHISNGDESVGIHPFWFMGLFIAWKPLG